ncbi:MAG: TIGR00266 family protein [Candidatus Micrarchaeaceae archaeon]
MQYAILGENMQALKLTLNEGEAVYADAGRLVSKHENVKMVPRMKGGILGAIERKAAGASAFVTDFQVAAGSANGDLILAGVLPGKVFPIELQEGQEFVAEDKAFLAATDSVKFSIQAVNISAAIFGGAGFFLQKFVGPGTVFLHVTGNIVVHTLDGTKAMEVDPRHIAGFDSGLSYKITFVDNIKSALFSGIGVFLAKFEGRGRLITHTVSRYKLSSEVYLEGLALNPPKH